MQTQPELRVDPNIFKKQFPRFDRPKILGYIGIENLKFAKKIEDKNVQYDLNALYDQAKRKPCDRDVKLNALLQFLIENKTRLDFPLPNNLDDALFCCYRGLLTCVACTPYENNEGWKIAVLLYKGNIFLCARDTEEITFRKQNMTEKDKRFTSWGHKFEQYMLSDTPTTNPNPYVPVDETEEFSLVFKGQLNRHTIIYGAEMDGIRCDKKTVSPPPTSEEGSEAIIEYLIDQEFIELKTNRHIEYKKQDRSFRRYKCKKWWCQSFLAGVDTILCGFRNDDGIVEELKSYSVRDIKKMSEQHWDPSVCFNFLDSFFIYLKRVLARKIKRKHGDKAVHNMQALPLISFLLEWTPGSAIQVNENYSHDDDPILTEEFMNAYSQVVK